MSFRTVTGWLSIESWVTLIENKKTREACILFCMMFLACAQSQFDIELLLLNKGSSDAELLRKENVAHKSKSNYGEKIDITTVPSSRDVYLTVWVK